jgi:hypothetical protein
MSASVFCAEPVVIRVMRLVRVRCLSTLTHTCSNTSNARNTSSTLPHICCNTSNAINTINTSTLLEHPFTHITRITTGIRFRPIRRCCGISWSKQPFTHITRITTGIRFRPIRRFCGISWSKQPFTHITRITTGIRFRPIRRCCGISWSRQLHPPSATPSIFPMLSEAVW